MNKRSAYLRLMRISLLPTAWSNVLLGYLLMQPELPNQSALLYVAGLLVCSSCFYIAGMVFNDVCDIELDRVERPERVLPSKQVSLRSARILGYCLVASGLVIAALLSLRMGKNGPMIGGTTLAISLVLVGLIFFYNVRAKRTWFGPIVMGLCRSFNVLFGGSLDSGLHLPEAEGLLWVAAAVGTYVAGITWLAKEENRTNGRFRLLGATLMLLAVGAIAVFAFSQVYSDFFQINYLRSPSARTPILFCGLLAIMVFPVVRRVLVALGSGKPRDVKVAVITSLLTIILIDASLCYLACPPHPEYALGVAALIVPAFLMSRKIMAT